MYRIDSAIRLFLLLSGQTITSDFFPPFVPSQILLSARYFGQSWRAATRLPVCWRPQRHRRDRLYGRLKITTLYSNNNPFFCSSSSLKKKFETDAVRTRSLRRKRQQQTTLKRKHLFPPPFFFRYPSTLPSKCLLIGLLVTHLRLCLYLFKKPSLEFWIRVSQPTLASQISSPPSLSLCLPSLEMSIFVFVETSTVMTVAWWNDNETSV